MLVQFPPTKSDKTVKNKTIAAVSSIEIKHVTIKSRDSTKWIENIAQSMMKSEADTIAVISEKHKCNLSSRMSIKYMGVKISSYGGFFPLEISDGFKAIHFSDTVY